MDTCPLSGKPCARPKPFPVSEQINGKTKTIYLCSDCVKDFFEDKRSQRDVLTELIDWLFPEAANFRPDMCPHCKTTLSHINRSGRPGCEHCQDFFGDDIQLTEEEAEDHGPEDEATDEILQQRLTELDGNISDLVKQEDYEKAAEVRDRLNRFRDHRLVLQKKMTDAVEEGDFDKATSIRSLISSAINEFLC